MKTKPMSAAAAAILTAALSIQSSLLSIAAQENFLNGQKNTSEIQQDQTVIHASNFGADPTGTFDSTEAIQNAFAAAKKAKEEGAASVRVEFEKGTYQIWKDKCEKRLAHTSNTSSTDGYGEKTIGLLIEDQEDLVVEGNDSLFMMHGNIMALAVIRSKNIELRNFAWDFAVPTTSEMTIIDLGTTENGKQYTDFYVPKNMPHTINNKTITWTSEKSIYTGETYWQENGIHWAWCFNANDPEGEFTRRFDTSESPFENVDSICHVEGTDDTVVRIVYTGNRPAMQKEGMTLELNANGRRETTGAFVWESENVTARGIDVHYMHGFGWLLQMSKDMYFYDCTMVPRENSGHLTTGYADGIHASGHSGEVVIENCRFASLHDDPINIHGTFTRVESLQDSHTLVLKNIHSQQGGYQQYFKGDKVQFFTRDTLESRDNEMQYTVAEVVSNPGEDGNDLKTMVVRFEEELPDFLTETYSGQPRFVAENVSYAPDVTIRGNTFRDLAARAVLCTSRGHVLVEDNIFYDMTMDGYNTSNDANLWYESGPVRDVTIRNNTFYVTETGASHNNKVINIDPVTLGGGFPDYTNPIHKNITIEGNTFHMGADTVVGAWSVENLTIRNNTILRADPSISIAIPEQNLSVAAGSTLQIPVETSGTQRTKSIENMYLFKNCKNVQIEGNVYDAGQKLYAWYDGMPESEIHITNDAVTTTKDLNQPAADPVKEVHYTSDDPETAWVDDDGVLHACKEGRVSIRAWSEWNGSVIESEPVEVTITTAQEQAAAPIIQQDDTVVLSGGEQSLSCSVISDLPVTWSVSAISGLADNASIDENGQLQVSGNALLKVTASSAAGSDSIVVIADSGLADGLNPAFSVFNENKSGYVLDGNQLTMTMLKGDLYFWNNSIQNLFMMDLPADVNPDHLRTVVYAENMPPRESNQWDTLSFILMNDNDNYITLGRKSHYDGLTAVREVDQNGSEMGGSASDNSFTSGWLGFTKEGSSVSLDYSADGVTWNHVRDVDGAFLSGYKIGLGTWVTNERGKTASFRDLKVADASVSYADMMQEESVLFNGLSNTAPEVQADLDKEAYSLGDVASVSVSTQDADGDSVQTLQYRWKLTDEDGTEKEIWTSSPSLEITQTGTLSCEVFVQDAAGLFAAAATQTASLQAGNKEGRILGVYINGRLMASADSGETEKDLLLPGCEKAVQLRVLTDGAEAKVNGTVFENAQFVEVSDQDDLVVSTKSASITLHVKKAASSKTALQSIGVEKLGFAWTPEDGDLPVLTTSTQNITLKTTAETGSVHLYNKLYGNTELASAKEQETAELNVHLTGGINTILIQNLAEDGISYEVTKLHIVYMPETSTESSVLINGEVVRPDETGKALFTLPEGETSAQLRVLTSAGQSARIIVNGQVIQKDSAVLEDLQNGANEVKIITTAADGISQNTVRLTLVKPYAQDTALSALTCDESRLEETAQILSVMTDQDSAVIRAISQNPKALVTVSSSTGSASGLGEAVLDASLFAQDNEITVTVLSPDGTASSSRTIQMEKARWMSDLDWDTGASIGYGSIKRDVEVEGTPLRLADENGNPVLYAKGIGSHANTSISWTLPAETYSALDGVVGVDYIKYGSTHANVTFTVKADGTEMFNSGIMYGNTPGKAFHLDLDGVSKVTLGATQTVDGNWDAHADFADLKLSMIQPEKAQSSLDLSRLEAAMRNTDKIRPAAAIPEKVEAWSAALAQGTDILQRAAAGDDTLTQEEVDAAAAAIETAHQNVLDTQFTANKMLLQMAVDQAELLQSQGALEGVNELVVQAFTDRLETAKAVLTDDNATQESVNKAWADLVQAIQMLNFTSDKTGLQALLTQAEAMDLSHVSKEAREQMEEAIAFAREVLDNPAALDDISIKEAMEKLQAAIAACSEVLDTTLLQILVDSVKDTDLSLYLETGKAEFLTALEQASAVLENPESQEQIADAISRLHSAWLNLRQKPDEDLLRALQQTVETLQVLREEPGMAAVMMSSIDAFIPEAVQALENPETDAGTISQLVKQGNELITAAENSLDPNGTGSDKDLVSGAPAGSESGTNSVSAQARPSDNAENRKAASSSVSRSVKTGVFASGGLVGLFASAAGLLALKKRKK